MLRGAKRRQQTGFTLIEVMVAILVFSVGLLAVAGLQTNSMRGGNSALLRTKAIQNCEDIMDRMRANRAAALANDYAINLGVTPTAPAYSGTTLSDLQDWKNSLKDNLPDGDGAIASNGTTITVTVGWRDSMGNGSIAVEGQL